MNKPEPDAKESSPPWGRWEVLLDEPVYKVKRVTVLPGKRLSYQKHIKRSEHWMVVEGKGMVTLDGKEMHIEKGNTVDIAREVAHRMSNNGDEVLTFIEIQQGDYFGEDDIIRLEDDYGRVST
jgi:mannose-6-phosphate isomerase-like protein (cupin superfamily)